jgi:hypothetical protein
MNGCEHTSETADSPAVTRLRNQERVEAGTDIEREDGLPRLDRAPFAIRVTRASYVCNGPHGFVELDHMAERLGGICEGVQ